MAGLLGDSMEDPRTLALFALAQGLSGNKRLLPGLLQGAQGYGATMASARQEEERRKRGLLQEQLIGQQIEQSKAAMEEQTRQRMRQQGIEGAYRNAIRTPDQQAMAANGGPTTAAAAMSPGLLPTVDQQALIQGLASADPMSAYQMLQPKPRKLMSVKPGDVVLDESDPTKPLFTAAEKPAAPPTSIQEFLYGQQNPQFTDWKRQNARAGASSVSINTAKPMLESVAGGLGKQIDESLAVAKAAVPSIQTAQTLRAAVDSGKMVAGPGATFRVLGLQVGQMLGVGGKDGAEILSNTRTAIQSMAQAELSAAQMMKGQGQITEAERDIIRRAAAGNINDLTGPEIRLLSDAMEKTARFKLKQHRGNVEGLSRMPGAAPLMPFYQVEEPPAYAAPASSGQAVRRYNPATGKIE